MGCPSGQEGEITGPAHRCFLHGSSKAGQAQAMGPRMFKCVLDEELPVIKSFSIKLECFLC